MYHMPSTAALAHILNQFSVPMFALERAAADAPYRFVCLNDAMESAAQCDRCNVVGQVIEDALPPEEQDSAIHRFDQCIETQGVLRFRNRFTLSKEQAVWDTTLQSAVLPDGRARVVATSIKQMGLAPHPTDTALFDDVQYFSSMADFQIQNLITMFETYQANDLFKTEAEQRIAKLSGMCRTVQRAVTDIKKSVRNARAHHDAPIPQTMRITPHQQMLNRCGTLKALTEFSAEASKRNLS